jgi:predicted nuclease of predicted toxin-antitoxin system
MVDAQLPPSLALWLRSRGCAAVHVEDISLQNADDRAIGELAVRDEYVLITKDRDFVPAAGVQSVELQIVWIRTGNISNRNLFERLEKQWAYVDAHLNAGARIVEVR